MRTSRILMAGVVGVAVTGAAWAQQGTAAANGAAGMIANGGMVHTLLAAPVVNEPYSATQVHETVQTLADGTTIRHKGHHFVARDSDGRVRVEMRMAAGQNGSPDTVLVLVSDPVSHTVTSWVAGPGVKTKLASVVKVPADAQERRQAAMAQAQAQARPVNDGRPQPVVTTEDLGPQMVSGVPVEDVRTTTIVPVGRAGNDAPITRTHEVWTSAEMKLVMKEEWKDPRTGVRTVELAEFSRAQPDAGLFRAPKGYEVKNAVESLREMTEKMEAAQQ